jgi:hypothetical protein
MNLIRRVFCALLHLRRTLASFLMTTPNQSPNAFRGFRGQFASTSALPNVAGSPTQDPTLAEGQYAYVGGAVYVCTDATEGAATWTQIATGATGNATEFRGVDLAAGSPDADIPESYVYDPDSGDFELRGARGELRALYNFFSSAYYQADSNGLGGGDQFSVVAIVQAHTLLVGSDQTIFSNYSSGSAGWKLEVKAGGQFAFTIVDSNGDDVTAQTVAVDFTNHPAGRPDGKCWVLWGQVSTSGGEATVELFVNGALAASTAAGAGHTMAGIDAAPRIGGGAGNDMQGCSLVGVAFVDGTSLAGARVASSVAGRLITREDIYDAVGAGTWTIYSVPRGNPDAAASWSPEPGGNGPPFSRNGSPEAYTIYGPIWG